MTTTAKCFVRNVFRTSLIELDNGRVISGMFRREEGDLVNFAEATGKELSVPKNTIESRRESDLSLMPEVFIDFRLTRNTMPNPWTGKGNPYTRTEVIERLHAALQRGEPILAAGAGTGISAKFIEAGGADLIIVYNSGRFRMAGHGSTAGLMAYGDANATAMEIGQYEVLPVVQEIPVICGVHATDPRRRMWHWLLEVKDMGFSGVNNFPTHCIVDGMFRQILEETGMGVQKEFEMVALARKMDLFSIVYVSHPNESRAMAEAGADAIIAHVGTTVGGAVGVKTATVTMEAAVRRTQAIIEAARSVRKDILFLTHGGPIARPEDAAYVIEHTDAVGFVGASSLERLAVEDSLTELTRQFKRIPGRTHEPLHGD